MNTFASSAPNTVRTIENELSIKQPRNNKLSQFQCHCKRYKNASSTRRSATGRTFLHFFSNGFLRLHCPFSLVPMARRTDALIFPADWSTLVQKWWWWWWKKTSRAQFFYERAAFEGNENHLKAFAFNVHSHVRFGAHTKNIGKKSSDVFVEFVPWIKWLAAWMAAHCAVCTINQTTHPHKTSVRRPTPFRLSPSVQCFGFDAGKSRQSPGPRIRWVPPINCRFPNISNILLGTD